MKPYTNYRDMGNGKQMGKDGKNKVAKSPVRLDLTSSIYRVDYAFHNKSTLANMIIIVTFSSASDSH